ncbi:hypothetical protein T440DRAFT_463695 [Plenodomus tracheiphilus IPT5]|uniref:Uncharacterized protein n=1 Tax=Plenodomus tracheiphilus IPT5 TaxID=1408161 RepID=A0A6A7BLU0_9PLEO|nr:hypothetical protein T440DRAFT_463695 [Plenodomus tracheiphilus IPT5]
MHKRSTSQHQPSLPPSSSHLPKYKPIVIILRQSRAPALNHTSTPSTLREHGDGGCVSEPEKPAADRRVAGRRPHLRPVGLVVLFANALSHSSMGRGMSLPPPRLSQYLVLCLRRTVLLRPVPKNGHVPLHIGDSWGWVKGPHDELVTLCFGPAISLICRERSCRILILEGKEENRLLNHVIHIMTWTSSAASPGDSLGRLSWIAG